MFYLARLQRVAQENIYKFYKYLNIYINERSNPTAIVSTHWVNLPLVSSHKFLYGEKDRGTQSLKIFKQLEFHYMR